MYIRFLVPHHVASELLEHTPTYFGGEPVTLVKSLVRGLKHEIREHVIYNNRLISSLH